MYMCYSNAVSVPCLNGSLPSKCCVPCHPTTLDTYTRVLCILNIQNVVVYNIIIIKPMMMNTEMIDEVLIVYILHCQIEKKIITIVC